MLFRDSCKIEKRLNAKYIAVTFGFIQVPVHKKSLLGDGIIKVHCSNTTIASKKDNITIPQ
jgi:hypothetical protein